MAIALSKSPSKVSIDTIDVPLSYYKKVIYLNRFISPLFDLRLIKDKYRENYSHYWNVSAVRFRSSHRWRECTREEACQNKFHALRELTLYEVRRAAGRRAKGWKSHSRRVKSYGISGKRWRCRARSSLPDHRTEDGASARSLSRAGCTMGCSWYTRNGTAGSRYGYQESIPSGLWSAITQSAR